MADIRDITRRIDARIYASRLVKAIARWGTTEKRGAFFSKPREVVVGGGEIRAIGISFETQYDDDVAQLDRGDSIDIDGYGTFRFVAELKAGGDESGKTVLILGTV